jgi:hemolysin activation/secretion protein
MRIAFLSLCLTALVPLSVRAQEILTEQDQQTPFITSLKGIVLATPSKGPETLPLFTKEGIDIEPLLKVPGPKEDLVALLTPHLGQTLSLADVNRIRSQITHFYTEHNRPIVSVLIPPQDVSVGILRLVVVEAKTGSIALKGNRWASDKLLLSRVAIKTGDPIDAQKIKRGLAWLNRNPFRQTDAFFYPGTTSGTTDLELVTRERFPFQPYVGADNTGTPLTQRTRLYTGFNAGNLWGLDHRLSYQYTTSPDWTSLSAHSGSYIIPFPWRHQAYAFGGYARSDVDVQRGMHQHAHSWQVSGRYQIPIEPIWGDFLQEISLGYDFKRSNNSLLFGGDIVASKYADINQFLLGYSCDFATRKSKTSLSVELYAAPFEMTSHQNRADYRVIRLYAAPRYAYGRVRLSETLQLPSHFQLKGLFAAQATGWNLLPSEMFGLGGYNTVRGYNERAVNADDAILASLEIDFSNISFFKSAESPPKDKLAFLSFFDYGLGIEHRVTPAEQKTDWLAGTGLGVRYSFGSYLMIRADVGFPLHRTGSGPHGPHAHVGATASY